MNKIKLTLVFILCFSISSACWAIGGKTRGGRCHASATINGVETSISASCDAPNVSCGYDTFPHGGPDCHITINGEVYDGELVYSDLDKQMPEL
jgi:hypothetical protein